MSIEGKTSRETSSLKQKSRSKNRPNLQRQGSKDSLSGQSNQPAYVEQLLKLKEEKRSVIDCYFKTSEISKNSVKIILLLPHFFTSDLIILGIG